MNASNIADYMRSVGHQAKVASAQMAAANAATKNKALKALAVLLRASEADLARANAVDIERALANGLAAPMVDRLKLTPNGLENCAQGCEKLAAMAEVIGEILGM